MKKIKPQSPVESPSAKQPEQSASRAPPTPPSPRATSPATLVSRTDVARAENEGLHHLPPSDKPAKPALAPTALEGEGGYSAARRYAKGVRRSIAEGDAEKLATDAVEALDGPEGHGLRDAAAVAGRRGA